MKKEIYIVNAYKWGSRENHSYTVGVFKSKQKAINCAVFERDYRGGKYTCDVEIFELDNDNKDYESKTIYSAKGRLI